MINEYIILSTFASYRADVTALTSYQKLTPQKLKNTTTHVSLATSNVSLHRNPLQKLHRNYNKNETCDNLLLNETLKGKARRTYDGDVIPF